MKTFKSLTTALAAAHRASADNLTTGQHPAVRVMQNVDTLRYEILATADERAAFLDRQRRENWRHRAIATVTAAA